MKYTEAYLGRIFILRLEHGDLLLKMLKRHRINSILVTRFLQEKSHHQTN